MNDIILTVNVNERRAKAIIPFLSIPPAGTLDFESRELIYEVFAKPQFVFSENVSGEINVSYPIDYAAVMGAELWDELAVYPIPIEDEYKRAVSEIVISEYISKVLLPMTQKTLSDTVQSLFGKQEKE